MNRVLAILFIVILISCKKDDQPKEPVSQSHIKYFGFALIDTYWDDPTDGIEKTNYIDEVEGFTNIADILVVAPADNIMNKLLRMDSVQVNSILHLSEIFFEHVGTDSPSGAEYSLRVDFESRWNEFVTVNNLEANHNLVQAFYIGEEPTWNGISYANLKLATDYVKTTIPDVPIMIVEAYPIIDELQIPTSVDWVGFDHYFVRNPNTDVEYLGELENLKSKFSTDDQKIVIIMDSHYIQEAHGDYAGIALSEMGEVANSYYKLAKAEPKTIAILGYFWPSGFDFPQSIGARNMPDSVLLEYFRIGSEITLKQE